jgi:hypothetical protein
MYINLLLYKNLKKIFIHSQSLTSNKDLQLLFAYCWKTYGEPPYRTSFAMQAVIHFHYEEG